VYKHLENQQKAYLLALLAVFFWSTMSSAFKITLRFIPFDQMLFWSSLTGFVTLLIINQLSGKAVRKQDITLRNIRSSAIMGLFNPFLYYLILFKAYDLLEAQVAGTLNYTWPIALVLLSIPLLKQKIGWPSILAVCISFFGIIIISTNGNLKLFELVNPLGVGLAVGSAFFWAVYWILNMKDKREETGKIMLNLFFGVIYILVYLVISGERINFPASQAVIGVIYIGLFEMSITFVIWLKALTYSVNTAKVSNLIYLSPFIALLIIRLTVGEQIHTSTIIGLVFIVGGIVFQQLTGKSRKNTG
jgi:drug/metabolite transporter (DMT)-like permease